MKVRVATPGSSGPTREATFQPHSQGLPDALEFDALVDEMCGQPEGLRIAQLVGDGGRRSRICAAASASNLQAHFALRCVIRWLAGCGFKNEFGTV